MPRKVLPKLLEDFIILKRFSEVWQAQEQLVLMNEFYSNIEKN
jgi:hypothetical protein